MMFHDKYFSRTPSHEARRYPATGLAYASHSFLCRAFMVLPPRMDKRSGIKGALGFGRKPQYFLQQNGFEYCAGCAYAARTVATPCLSKHCKPYHALARIYRAWLSLFEYVSVIQRRFISLLAFLLFFYRLHHDLYPQTAPPYSRLYRNWRSWDIPFGCRHVLYGQPSKSSVVSSAYFWKMLDINGLFMAGQSGAVYSVRCFWLVVAALCRSSGMARTHRCGRTADPVGLGYHRAGNQALRLPLVPPLIFFLSSILFAGIPRLSFFAPAFRRGLSFGGAPCA